MTDVSSGPLVIVFFFYCLLNEDIHVPFHWKSIQRVPFLQVKENTGEEKDYQGKIREGVGAAEGSWRSDGACQPAGRGEGRGPTVRVTAPSLPQDQHPLYFNSVCRFSMCGYLFWHKNSPGCKIKDAPWDYFSCILIQQPLITVEWDL